MPENLKHAIFCQWLLGAEQMTAVFSRDLHHDYPVAVRGGGMYLYDQHDREYLDMCGGAAVSSLGHQHPAVVSTIQKQIETMAFAHTAFFSNEPQERLAALLVDAFGEADARAYFASGGSEANETALKFAWQYWRARAQPTKVKIISRTHSYHGNTFGALSVSGHPARRSVMPDLLLDWPRIDPCYAYRFQQSGETEEEYGERAAQMLEQAILREGADTIAAFIAEPIVGASLGVVSAAKGYFTKIRAICDKYDILLIADEVMCGSGRTGTFFAFEQEGFRPDIVTLAKGLGGGYQPLAATIVCARISNFFTTSTAGFAHGHTYIGHAAACAAGVAVMQTIERQNLLAAVRTKGTEFGFMLKGTLAEHPNVGDIRGRGLFWAIELVEDKAEKTLFANSAQLAKQLKNTAMQHGLMCYPGGGNAEDGLNCHILLAPPYIVEHHHMDQAMAKLTAILTEVFGA